MKRATHHTIRKTPATNINKIIFSDLVHAVEAGDIIISPFARHVPEDEHPLCSDVDDDAMPLLTFCTCSNGKSYLVGGINQYVACKTMPLEGRREVLAQLITAVEPEGLYDLTCACNAYRLPEPPHAPFSLPATVLRCLARYSHTMLLADEPAVVYAQRCDNVVIAAAILCACLDTQPGELHRHSMLASLCECAEEFDTANWLQYGQPLADSIFMRMAQSFAMIQPATLRYARNARFMSALAYVLAEHFYSCADIAELTTMLFATKRRDCTYGQISADGDSVRGCQRRIAYIRDCLDVKAWTLDPELSPDNLLYTDNRRYVYATLDDRSILVPLNALSSVERAVLSGVSGNPYAYYDTLNRYHSNLALFGRAV